MGIRFGLIGGALVAGALLTSTEVWAQAKTAAEKPPEPPPLPAASARLWLIAPTAIGPWTMRIENEGTIAVRVPADGRLLRLEVQTDETAKPISCTLPSSLRSAKFPEDRALLLAPGHSYVESFDPQLYCFGKSAVKFGPNMLVHARFGWDTPKAPKIKTNTKKPPTGPFAVESTEREPTIAPLWEIAAPSIVLGAVKPQAPATIPPPNPENAPKAETTETKEGAGEANPPMQEGSSETNKPPPVASAPVDERAGKLELSSSAFVEASAPRTITINVTAKNVGLRPIVAALRPWMMSFRIDAPGGDVQMCYADNARRALPQDAYRSVAPGASTSFAVLLAEVCPKNIFVRPGLYRVTVTMAAKESTNGVDVKPLPLGTREPSLVRLTSADEPFYAEPPKAVAPAPVEMPAD